MTDRVKGCWVAFDNDIRDDDVEDIVNAIMMVKHVQAVTTMKANGEDWMNRARIKNEIREKLFALVE